MTHQIRFYGHSERLEGNKDISLGGREVLAIAYDVPIPGYEAKMTNNLRLWESRRKRGFDPQSFHEKCCCCSCVKGEKEKERMQADAVFS